MGLLSSIIQKFSYDFYLKRDGYNLKNYYNELMRSQFYTAEELGKIQFDKLKKLLTYCFENNKFYSDRFAQAGFHPNDLKKLEDIKKLPVLTKDDIRSNTSEMFSNGFSPMNTVNKRTGGSTGVPLKIYLDWEAASYKRAAVLRHNRWANLIPGTQTASIWGDTLGKQSLKEKIRNALTERIFYLDTLKFEPAYLNSFINQLKNKKPEILFGHAHSVFRLAEYVKNQKINNIRFEGIITTAMVLTDGERKVIETVFDSPVFNRYGSEELSLISSECPAHAGMHIFSEGLYLEIIGETKTRPGKLLITDLVNKAMPLIRYEIGDYAYALPGECPCGRGLPRLKEVSGRTADFLYTPQKQPVFGISILDTFVIHLPGIKQLQIVQDKYEHLNFNIVKAEDFSDDTLSKLKDTVAEIFSPEMTYSINYVEQIKQTERGKFRFSICNIKQEPQS